MDSFWFWFNDTLRGARRVTGPGFTLTINGEAAAGDVSIFRLFPVRHLVCVFS